MNKNTVNIDITNDIQPTIFQQKRFWRKQKLLPYSNTEGLEKPSYTNFIKNDNKGGCPYAFTTRFSGKFKKDFSN